MADDSHWDPIRLRKEGCLGLAREAGIQLNVLEMPPDVGESNVMAWLTPQLRDLRPDGIYATSSLTSVGTLHACINAGLRVPDETCLVGCDASFWRAPGWQAITSVDVCWYEAGELAVRKMVEMRGGTDARFDNLILAPRVCAGDTCPVDESLCGSASAAGGA